MAQRFRRTDDPNYNDYRTNFGQTAGSGSDASPTVTVPEPAMLMLLMLAAALTGGIGSSKSH
jgi:hypothetical protein